MKVNNSCLLTSTRAANVNCIENFVNIIRRLQRGYAMIRSTQAWQL